MFSRSTLVTIAAMLVIGSGAFFAGRNTQPAAQPPDSHSAETMEVAAQSQNTLNGQPRQTASDLLASNSLTTPSIGSGSDAGLPYAQFDSPLGIMSLRSDFEQTVALYTLVGRADVATLERYLDETSSIVTESDRNAARQIIFQRFIEVAPDAALAQAERIASPQRDQILFGLFTSWAKADLDSAIAHIQQMSPQRRQWAQQAILRPFSDDPTTVGYIVGKFSGSDGTLAGHRADPVLLAQAKTNPEAAMDAAAKLTNAAIKRTTMNMISGLWAHQDPAAALAYVENSEHGQRLQDRMLAIVGQTEPERALDFMNSKPNGRYWHTLHAAISKLASSDPQRALQRAGEVRHVDQRAQALSLALSHWPRDEVDDAVATLNAMDGLGMNQRMSLASSLASNIAQYDPMAALEIAEEIEGFKGEAWQQMIVMVANADPLEALNIIETMEPSPRRVQALSQVIQGMAQTDPYGAINHLDKLPPGRYQSMAVQHVANHWAHQDPAAAIEWSLTLTGSLQTTVLQSLSYSIAEQDPELAMAFVDQIGNPRARSNWINAVTSSFAQRDPEDAAAWLEQYRDQPDYGQWIAQVASATVSSNPRLGIKMLAGIENSEQRRMATQNFAMSWSHRDPRAAAKWFNRLKSEQRDTDALKTIVSQWRNFEPKVAERWVLNLRATAERDAGIVALVGDEAWEWRDLRRLIDKISEPELRDRTYASSIRQLSHYDPALARQALEQSTVSSHQHAQLDQYLTQLEEQNRPGIFH